MSARSLATNVARIALTGAAIGSLTARQTRRRLQAEYRACVASAERLAGTKAAIPMVPRWTWYRAVRALVGPLRALRDFPDRRQLELPFGDGNSLGGG